jgi:flavin-dependent dehydrogenase
VRHFKKVDVIIVGAGVAGCASAIAIKKDNPGLEVCIIDRKNDDGERVSVAQIKIGETLPPQVMIPMQKLGIWEQFKAAEFARSAGTLAIWGNYQPHANESIFSPYGDSWHLDRVRFDSMMIDLAAQAGIQFMLGVGLSSIDKEGGQWCLTLQPGDRPNSNVKQLHGSFIIDATGRVAAVASRLGAIKQRIDQLIGIYRFYQINSVAQGRDSSTRIESAPNGWWYAAQLSESRRVVALMTDADHGRFSALRKPLKFEQARRETMLMTELTESMQPICDPFVTAAHSQCLDQVAGAGWLATGDAAFTYDPLSSLGIFKALRMALLTSYAVKDFYNFKDPELKKYQALARAEFTQYLNKRTEYYNQETRFADNSFWQRRHQQQSKSAA